MILKNYTFKTDWNQDFDMFLDSPQTLILVFGSAERAAIKRPLEKLRHCFPTSIIMGASTIAKILMDDISDASLVVTVIKFERTTIKLSTKQIPSLLDSHAIGAEIAQKLQTRTLNNIFILSDGLNINGSQLIDGFNSEIAPDVLLSGGLAGDNGAFQSTWILINGEALSGYVSAVGFYGDAIKSDTAFDAGWDIFGIRREVTKASANVVYELDNHSILDIYKKYLGEKAKELPASGLLFPLGIYADTHDKKNILIRTILGINEAEGSITFAGDIPEGSSVGLMKSNNDRLIDAAYTAVQKLRFEGHSNEPILNIAISCIGRKLVLKQRVDEELEVVLEELPHNTLQIGFYSFGEISKSATKHCDLHNQTMTLTTLWEKNA